MTTTILEAALKDLEERKANYVAAQEWKKAAHCYRAICEIYRVIEAARTKSTAARS
jgi:hypothetical protein